MRQPRVMVLMSTYNGGQFLREQIDSILAQKGVEVRLLVRDDGSKDDTCAIRSEYASAHRANALTVFHHYLTNHIEVFPLTNKTL